MSRPRYVVQTVTGFSLNMPLRWGSGSGAAKVPGVSAHVCDSLYLYEVVASYRSERRRNGCELAVRDAVEHAARLNGR